MSITAAGGSGSISQEQAQFLLHTIFLPSIRGEMAITRRVIEAIPYDQADFRPDSVGRTAIDLAWHIVTAEHRFHEAVASGEFNLTPSPRPDSVRNSADIAAWYSETFARDIQRLEQLSGEQLTKVIDFRGLLKFPAVAYLQVGMNHSIHHRGQLSTYLRRMGAKVPSIYGESYDSAEARKAVEASNATTAS